MVEEEAPFLAGHGRQGLDLSPVKIVKVCLIYVLVSFSCPVRKVHEDLLISPFHPHPYQRP